MSQKFFVALLGFHFFIQSSSATALNRSDRGSAITTQEKQQATRELVELLKDTRYFDFIDSRIHGIPKNNTENKFWYSHMWSGVKVAKTNGQVSFTHMNTGADNVGIHSTPLMEGACYSFLLTGNKKHAEIARSMIRGFSSWLLSSARSQNDSSTVLSRVLYPSSFSTNEKGRNLRVDYGANRPGIYNGVAEYVHIPNNPSFGDIWVKNNRSTDDIGQMIRGIHQVNSCREAFDSETQADLDQMNRLYANWAATVEAAGFVIPTHNTKAEIYIPYGNIGDYNKYDYFGLNPNCSGKLAIRLLRSGSAGKIDCANGISKMEVGLDKYLKNDAIEILRSHHIASVLGTQKRGLTNAHEKLLAGLFQRLDRDMNVVKNPKKYPQLDIQDIAAFFIHAYNSGAELTSEEIRFIYSQLHIAHTQMRSPAHFATFNLFDDSVPDGTYSYEAPQNGLYFYTLGTLLGTCTSKYRAQTQRSPLDCEALRTALPASF